MTVSQPVVPAWADPRADAIGDLLTVSARYSGAYTRGCYAAAEWATGCPISLGDAGDRMTEALQGCGDQYERGIADTLAWLMGMAGPPIELPRRNPDGTLVTAEQLYAELVAEHPLPPAPEERQQFQERAREQAARWAVLAGC